MWRVLLISLISVLSTNGCTLDPSVSFVITDAVTDLNQIKSNISVLNETISNYTRIHESEIYIRNIEVSLDKALKLVYLLNYNNTNSVTIKQYTETYFPAISLTVSLLLLILALINLITQCKRYRKPLIF